MLVLGLSPPPPLLMPTLLYLLYADLDSFRISRKSTKRGVYLLDLQISATSKQFNNLLIECT